MGLAGCQSGPACAFDIDLTVFGFHAWCRERLIANLAIKKFGRHALHDGYDFPWTEHCRGKYLGCPSRLKC